MFTASETPAPDVPQHDFSAPTHTFILRPSTIPNAGIGCFSGDAIAAGEQLSPGFTERFRHLSEAEIPDLYLKYCVLLPSGHFLAPQNFLRMGVFWYLNHAKRPNLEFRQQTLYALVDIDPETELTLYYSDLLTHPKNQLWVQPHHI